VATLASTRNPEHRTRNGCPQRCIVLECTDSAGPQGEQEASQKFKILICRAFNSLQRTWPGRPDFE
jgi:hypothetical protein